MTDVDILTTQREYLTKRFFFVGDFCLGLIVSIICYLKKMILVLRINFAIQRHFSHSL